jgi:hypothetical protein
LVHRSHHDMGGMDAGPVEQIDHVHVLWEKRTDAIMRLVTDKDRRIMTVDELRRGIEQLGPEVYDKMSYYERWITSVTNNLLEKGTINVDELGRKMAKIEARWQADGATKV